MNRILARSSAIAIFLVFATWMAPLSGQSEEQIKRFNEERKAYFNENLALTEAEADAFWPLYNDFHNRKMKIMDDERNAFSYAKKNAENLSDTEITEILDKIRSLKKEQLKLEEEYYQDKFMEALPPKKVLKLYKVEWDFRRHLVRQLRGQEHGERRKSDGGRDGAQGGGQHPGPMGPPPECMF